MQFREWARQPFVWGKQATDFITSIVGHPAIVSGILAGMVGLTAGAIVPNYLPQKTPSIVLPATMDAAPGDLVELQAATNGANVIWETDCKKCDFKSLGSQQSAIYVFKNAGKYRVTAHTAVAGNIATSWTDVTVITPVPPVPPQPVPPQPVPPQPVPPQPVPPIPPIPPAPVDSLTQALTAAYTAENDPAKQANAHLLGALYANASKSTVNDETLTTTVALYAELHGAVNTLIGDKALPTVRAAIATYLNTQLGTTSVPLSADVRIKIGSTFISIANILEKF